jgi:hypothetical protein
MKKEKIDIPDKRVKNLLTNQKKSSSYGGYGGNSPANMNSAIEEFDDNLNVDWDDAGADESSQVSEINRIGVKNSESEKDDQAQTKPDQDNLNRKRAEGFDRSRKKIKKSKTEDNSNK